MPRDVPVTRTDLPAMVVAMGGSFLCLQRGRYEPMGKSIACSGESATQGMRRLALRADAAARHALAGDRIGRLRALEFASTVRVPATPIPLLAGRAAREPRLRSPP